MSLAINPETNGAAAAVRLASARTGVDFGYLYTQAKVESGLDPAAAATTSSARGLFQFTSATWLDTVRRHGAEHGLGWAAKAVGGAAARDPAVRRAVLDLRRDPQASALMAGELAGDNAARLEAGLGRAATPTDLYMAHFLGAAGALRFLRARDATPNAAAAEVAPAAAQANRGVFFARDGSARSLSAVYDRFAARFGGNPVPPAGSDLPVAPRSWPAPVSAGMSPLAPLPTAPQAARFAYLLLAELGA